MAKQSGQSGKDRAKDRHKRPRESFHLDDDLRAALTRCALESDPPSDKTSVIIAALRAYLAQRGFWKPPPRAKE